MALYFQEIYNTELVDEMIGIDIDEWSNINWENAASKWCARVNRTIPHLIRKPESKDYLKGIPNDWCTIIKQQFSLCPQCKNVTRNASHMEIKHGIEIFPYKDLWQMIKNYYNFKDEKQKQKNKIMKVKREVFLNKWKPILKEMKETIQKRMNSVWTKSL